MSERLGWVCMAPLRKAQPIQAPESPHSLESYRVRHPPDLSRSAPVKKPRWDKRVVHGPSQVREFRVDGRLARISEPRLALRLRAPVAQPGRLRPVQLDGS